jgi:hypothetical protein
VRRFYLLLGVFLLLSPLPLAAAGFEVSELDARLDGEQYLMEARIAYGFSDKAIEALVNGVPLTLEVHVQLRDEDAWIWQEDLLDLRLRYRIRYLALAGVYQIHDLQSDYTQSFHTQRSAVEALGEIRNFPLIDAKRLHSGRAYRLSLRSGLDIEALPLPLRPMAYLTSSWKLQSKWRTRIIRP